jgi:hypothetical protein
VDIFVAEDFNDLAHAPALKSALEPVLRAAESGHPDDLKAATDRVATVLRIWRMMA